MSEENRIDKIQNKIGYNFENTELLRQALTTPQFGYEHNEKDYEILETIGDSVIKIILILKNYKKGKRSPGEITKLKQQLENNDVFKRIAQKYFKLEKYIYKTQSQPIKGTKILADVFEALCGALFLDSQEDLQVVEHIIIDKFYSDWSEIVKNSSVWNKNILLELLQSKFKETPRIETDFQALGPDNDLIWIARNPRIYNKNDKLLVEITSHINHLESKKSRSKKEAEKNLYYQMFQKLKSKI